MDSETKRLIIEMIENVCRVVSDDERGEHDPAWLAGYVTGQLHAIETLVERATE